MTVEVRRMSNEAKDSFLKEGQAFEVLDIVRRASDRFLRLAWIAVGVLSTLTLLAFGGIIYLLPEIRSKPPQHDFALIHDNGDVGPAVAARDAPKSFSEQTDHAQLRTYIEDREGYTWDMDRAFFERVQIKSCPDERKRYVSWHNGPTAPAQRLTQKGKIAVGTFDWFPQGTGRNGTKAYVVQYRVQETLNQSTGPWVPHRVFVEFSYHPEMKMTPDEREKNYTGLQVCHYEMRD